MPHMCINAGYKDAKYDSKKTHKACGGIQIYFPYGYNDCIHCAMLWKIKCLDWNGSIIYDLIIKRTKEY